MDCSYYTTYPELCGYFDDDDFDSNSMCCTCGGGGVNLCVNSNDGATDIDGDNCDTYRL